jgi:hypothetical protein
MTKDEALRLALEALEPEPYLATWYIQECVVPAAITAIKATLEANEFNPDWDTQAVLVEEIQRMAKRIEELEAKDEPVVWGASSISKPEYIAEQKEKTKELRKMMDESVQTIPNFDQLQQIVNNLERCLTRDSKHEFLRVWIRDWTEHKLSKDTSAALEAKDEPFGYFQYDIRLDAWVQNRINNKGVAFYTKETKE